MTRVAAIDCGTNSLRLLVADVPPAGRPEAGREPALRDVVRRMEVVRLGEGVDATGTFAPAAIERTRVVLADYARLIATLGAERVRMVATSASRDVTNRADFEAMVRRTLGRAPDVISGEEEARLSFAGATRDLAGVDPPYLVLDIGGGSTEFVLGGRDSGRDSGQGFSRDLSRDDSRHDVVGAASVDIGCVRLTERHLHTDPPTAAEIAAAEADIRAGVTEAGRALDLSEAASLVGLAGSVTTVAALALELPTYDAERIHLARIGAEQVKAVTTMLLGATRAERAALPVMHPGRVDVIGAGALILRTVMEQTHLDSVLASEHDILDGMALALALALAEG